MKDFIVVDTEGKGTISEIAVVNSSGEVIFEEFVTDEKDLKNILIKFNTIATDKTIVGHYVKHDVEILQNSFNKINLTFKYDSICTIELAKELIDIESYSLKNLSTYLNIKHNENFFNEDIAHRASYDAIFTYKLYKLLLDISSTKSIAKENNPFNSSKVDNPFQTHYDFNDIYKNQFNQLLLTLNEIKKDTNNQTKSLVVLGEAGIGKTHLMMRFVKNVSKTNRFLFIRQPNNPNSVLFHIYARTIESFKEKIDNSKYSQLEYLLAKSFSKIIINDIENNKITQVKSKIKDILSQNHLSIYEKFGKDSSKQKSNNWKTLTKMMLKWLKSEKSSDLISENLLKALLKYTYYKDESKREIILRYLGGNEIDADELNSVDLIPWNNDYSKEEFALQAISLLGKLSIFDEPMILCFDQLESMKYDNELLMKFGESLKELITHTPNTLIIINLFPDRWINFCNNFDSSITDRLGSEIIKLQKPSKDKLINLLKERANLYDINLDHIFNSYHYNEITKLSSIRSTINQANNYFKHIIHEIPLPDNDIFTTEEKLELLTKEVEELKIAINKLSGKKIELKPISENIEQFIEKKYNEMELNYKTPYIINDADDAGKLRTIILAIKNIYNLKIDFIKMKKVFPEHIKISNHKYTYVVGFLNLEANQFISRLKNFNSIVINDKNTKFRLFRDARSPKVKSKKTIEEKEKLNNIKNGKFIDMDKNDRIIFETFYEIISAYDNKDIDFKLVDLIEGLTKIYKDFWLSKFLIS
ncbi:MAG: hypothetical protein U9N02_04485 [Campylobacterota bacterium]|nr:hypothetical protein [Campylobacterota bacterium]